MLGPFGEPKPVPVAYSEPPTIRVGIKIKNISWIFMDIIDHDVD